MIVEMGEENISAFTKVINRVCYNLRLIFHNNYSFFTLLFLLLYSFEQGLLIYFSY